MLTTILGQKKDAQLTLYLSHAYKQTISFKSFQSIFPQKEPCTFILNLFLSKSFCFCSMYIELIPVKAIFLFPISIKHSNSIFQVQTFQQFLRRLQKCFNIRSYIKLCHLVVAKLELQFLTCFLAFTGLPYLPILSYWQYMTIHCIYIQKVK